MKDYKLLGNIILGVWILKRELLLIVFVLFLGLVLGGAVSATNVTTQNKVSIAPYKDLVVTFVTITGGDGSDIYVVNTVKNQGNTKITNKFKTNFYLSNEVSGSKIFIGVRYISYLPAKGHSTKITTLRIPKNIKFGKYYILAITDATNTVKESNGKNNYKYSSSDINIKATNSINNPKIGDTRIVGLHDRTVTKGSTVTYAAELLSWQLFWDDKAGEYFDWENVHRGYLDFYLYHEGKQVWHDQVNIKDWAAITEINTQNLPSGMYHILVKYEGDGEFYNSCESNALLNIK